MTLNAESDQSDTRHRGDLEKDIKRKTPIIKQYDYTFAEKVKDFFYFNDFYIVSFLLIIFLMYLIFKT